MKRKFLGWIYPVFLFLLSGMTFPKNAAAIDLDRVISRISAGAQVAIYSGSFDPIHLGHEEAIELGLKYNSYVFVNVDERHNGFKPFRTPWRWRTLGVGKLFESNERVITSVRKFTEAKEALRARGVVFTQILGSDNFVRKVAQAKAGEPLHSDTDQWLVVWRASELGQKKYEDLRTLTHLEASLRFAKPQNGADLRIEHLFPIQNHFSSSKLRSSPDEEIKKSVSPIIYEWMNSFPFFKKFSASLSSEGFTLEEEGQKESDRQVRTTFEAQVKSRVVALLQEQGIQLPDGSEVISGDSVGTQGVSGNLLFLVRDSEKQLLYVAKIFVTSEMKNQFTNEKASLKMFRELGLKESVGVHEVASAETKTEKGNPYSIVIVSPASGKIIDQYLSDLNASHGDARNLKLQELTRVLIRAGRAFAELHAKETHPLSELSPEAYTELTKDFEPILKKIADSLQRNEGYFPKDVDLIVKLQAAITLITQEFKRMPGYLSLNHGDMSVNNFFYDLERDSFTQIDTGTMNRYLKGGVPIGFPARDYFQFISSLYMMIGSKGYTFSQNELRHLLGAFSASYDSYLQEQQKPVGPAAKKFFQMVWALKGIRFNLQFLRFEVNPAQLEFLKGDIQRCLNDILRASHE